MTVRQVEKVGATRLPLLEIPMVELVEDVYASASPPVRAHILSLMVGKVYQIAPPTERGLLIKHLMRPVGLLALGAIANGVFTSIRFQGGFNNLQAKMEDLHAIREHDVVSLANHVQQVSAQAVNGLGEILVSSPALAGSTVAIVLIKILMDRTKNRRNDDSRICSMPRSLERRSSSQASKPSHIE